MSDILDGASDKQIEDINAGKAVDGMPATAAEISNTESAPRTGELANQIAVLENIITGLRGDVIKALELATSAMNEAQEVRALINIQANDLNETFMNKLNNIKVICA